MPITTGTGTIAKRAETLAQQWGSPVSLNTVNGAISRYAGSTGSLFVDFTKRRPDMPPHSGLGNFFIYDGKGVPILAIAQAEIQIEEGARDGAWRTVAAFTAKGQDSVSGLVFIVATDHKYDDETSLGIAFASSDNASLASRAEAMQWGVKNGVV